MVRKGKNVIVGEIELEATGGNVQMNFILSQSVVSVTFDKKDSAKLVKELSEWLNLPTESKIEGTT